MKTTFSRTFSTTIMILLFALILVGTSFQALVEDYLTESAVAELQQKLQERKIPLHIWDLKG